MPLLHIVFTLSGSVYRAAYSNELRYALKCREKSFPFSTHVKMFQEVSKALLRLYLCNMSRRLKPSIIMLIVQGGPLE